MPAEGRVACARCGREPREDEPIQGAFLPEDWEGTQDEAICPGCQLAVWHPYCQTIVDRDGLPVDVQNIPVEEMAGLVRYCEYFDQAVAWYDGEDMPAWTCPECGGTSYIWMHPPE